MEGVFTVLTEQEVTSTATTTKEVTLQSYNDWNLPFTKTLTVSKQENEIQSFPDSKYIMELSPASFFSIIFVDSSLSMPTETIKLNYTWYGQNDFTIEGVWVKVDISLTIDEDEIVVPLTVFVSYMASPESGIQGILGLV